jgi:2,4-dienoyl-CoA reductase-like NADH-dependent reductase (Old Yellow Enzyme family)
MSSLLFQPCPLGSLMLSNRIVIAPMCQYSAQDGCATDWHLMHLGQMALSGAGLLIIEASAVEPEGRITAEDLGLWSDANEAALSRVLDAVRTYSDMPIAIQIAHAGRKASVARPWEGGAQIAPAEGGWQTVAPSRSLMHRANTRRWRSMKGSGAHPQRVRGHRATRRPAGIRRHRSACRARLSAAPVPDAAGQRTRTDAYGGSLDNRMRFPLEVFDAVRNAFPADKPVGVRISASDWVDGGWDVDQSVAFTQALKARGAGYIHVSSGGASPLQQIPAVPGYQLEFAERIRKEVGLPTIAVGLITEAEQAEAIIASGQADFVALARGMLYDPRWPWHAAAKLGAQVDAAPQYLRCQPRELKTLFR